jgi:hypothetical protein
VNLEAGHFGHALLLPFSPHPTRRLPPRDARRRLWCCIDGIAVAASPPVWVTKVHCHSTIKC